MMSGRNPLAMRCLNFPICKMEIAIPVLHFPMVFMRTQCSDSYVLALWIVKMMQLSGVSSSQMMCGPAAFPPVPLCTAPEVYCH